MKKCEFCLRRCLRRLVVARSLLPAGTANTADGTGKAAAHGITMGTSTEGTITAAADGGMADGGRGAVRAGNGTPRPVAGFGPAVEQVGRPVWKWMRYLEDTQSNHWSRIHSSW